MASVKEEILQSQKDMEKLDSFILERIGQNAQALQNSKGSISELKALKSPPADVKLTLDLVMIIFGMKTAWTDAISAMKDANKFMLLLQECDYSKAEKKVYEKILDKLEQNPQLTFEHIKKRSAAAAQIIIWVLGWVDIVKAQIQKNDLEDQINNLETTGKRHKDIVLTPELIGMIVAQQVKSQVDKQIRKEIRH